MHSFGSCMTGLRLPYGDIDLMFETGASNSDKVAQRRMVLRMARELRRRKGSIASHITAIKHARVPIIKWTDAQSGLQVDASFNNTDGLVNTASLARAVAATPAMRPLTLVLKSQLMREGLNETVTGGVGGYLLANMVRHVLLSPPPPSPPPPSPPSSPQVSSARKRIGSRR